ncbi:MAG TPA: EamA family transporter, partial [Acinetobacter junii]|nr:EamA family transporter [Acinetobacter junii]
WQETPDFYSLFGFGLILLAIILCSPLSQRQRKSL